MDQELRDNLKREPITDLDPTPALTIKTHATIHEALDLMRETKSGCILIVDEDRVLRGIFTERDLIRSVLGPGRLLSTRIDEVMTSTPNTLKRLDTAAYALEKFISCGIRHLPIVDDEGKPTGVLSVKRMAHYLAEVCAEKVYCLPPDPNRISTELYSG